MAGRAAPPARAPRGGWRNGGGAALRQAGAAALLAGEAQEAGLLGERLAARTGAAAGPARELIALAAASHRAPSLPAPEAGAAALAALAPLAGAAWAARGPLDAPAAAVCNNLASALLERPASDLAHPALRQALEWAAARAEQLWLRAGSWLHHERAAYLRALAARALGDPRAAREHAERGLALLAENDSDGEQLADRAFLELERADALGRLGDSAGAHAAEATARAAAAGFAADAELSREFEERSRRLATS